MQHIDFEYSVATKAAQVQFEIHLLTDPLNLYIRHNFPSVSTDMDFADCCEYIIKNSHIDVKNKKIFEMALLQRHRVAHQDRKFIVNWTCPTYSFKLLATFIDQQDLNATIENFVSFSNTFSYQRNTDLGQSDMISTYGRATQIENSQEYFFAMEPTRAAQIQFAMQLLTSALNTFIFHNSIYKDKDFSECCDYMLKNNKKLQDKDIKTFRSAFILRQAVAHQNLNSLLPNSYHMEHFKSLALLIGEEGLKTSIEHFVSKFKMPHTSTKTITYIPESAIAHGSPDDGSVILKVFIASLMVIGAFFAFRLARD